MNFENYKFNKYIKVLSRLGKQFSPVEGYLIMMRSYATNNVYFYINPNSTTLDKVYINSSHQVPQNKPALYSAPSNVFLNATCCL